LPLLPGERRVFSVSTGNRDATFPRFGGHNSGSPDPRQVRTGSNTPRLADTTGEETVKRRVTVVLPVQAGANIKSDREPKCYKRGCS
jgi:hypothetical protein